MRKRLGRSRSLKMVSPRGVQIEKGRRNQMLELIAPLRRTVDVLKIKPLAFRVIVVERSDLVREEW